MMITGALHKAANALLAAFNCADADTAITLFSPDAVIDDPSTGHRFDGHAGIRDYIERYFKGFHTVTRLLSIESIGEGQARLRVDFNGDFGHEIGLLNICINAEGLICRIDADLEGDIHVEHQPPRKIMDFYSIEDSISLAAWAAGAKGSGAPNASLHWDPRCDATSMVDLDLHRLEVRRQELAAA